VIAERFAEPYRRKETSAMSRTLRTATPAILTLLTLGAAALLVAPAAGQALHPRAVMPDPVYDAGGVAKGEKISHDFVIRNDGEAPLEISDVRPACGCTVAEFDKVIAPGETGAVRAVLDTMTFDGPISKAITVFTNDPVNPKLQLSVKADVRPYLFIQPGYARFVQAQQSEPGVVQQIVFTTTFDDLKITEVESPYPFLKVAYREATEEDEPRDYGVGRQWVLTLTLDYTTAPVGTLAEYVTLHTNHPNQPVAKLPVSGFVRPMIAVTPTAADFGEIEVDEAQNASMLIRSFATEDVAVTSAETDVPGVALEVTPIEEGKRYGLQVTLSPEMPKGSFDGTITIRTDSPKAPLIEVPLRGTRI
jgi:hypothetical protein